jgi:bifunctional non-homologous end joining protein LigD
MPTLSSHDSRPAITAPMGCLAVKDLPQGEDWQYEVMWKGQRVFGGKQGRQGSLYLPDGSAFDRGFSELQRDMARLNCRAAVVDGQIVPLGRDGRPSFQYGTTDSVALVVYDLLSFEGHDLRGLPLNIRREALSKILPPANGSRIILSQELEGRPEQILEEARKCGVEAIVAKKRYAPYAAGKSSGAWVKRNVELTETFFIGGYMPGLPGPEEVMIGEWPRPVLCYVGKLKEGLSPDIRHTIAYMRAEGVCPFVDLRDAAKEDKEVAYHIEDYHWVKPKEVVEVAYLQRGEGRKLKQPRLLAAA